MMAEIEKRQSAILKDHAEHLGEILEFRRRTDQNLSEITGKLNGLIGYVVGFPPPQPHAEPTRSPIPLFCNILPKTGGPQRVLPFDPYYPRPMQLTSFHFIPVAH